MSSNPEINLPAGSELGVSDYNKAGIRERPEMRFNSTERPSSYDPAGETDNDVENEEYIAKEKEEDGNESQENLREADIVWHYLTFDTELPHPSTIHPTQPGQEPPPEPPNLVKYTNPFDWSETRKQVTIWISSVITALTAFSAGSYSPGVYQMTQEWGVSSVAALAGITVFTTGFAFAPMFLAPFSEINGRRPVFLASGVLFVVCQLCSSLTQSYGGMLAARFFLGIGGSTFSTMVGGVVSDIYHAKDRNTPMALFSGSALFGTALGPLVCGFIAQNTTWRWIFYLQVITCGMMVALICVVFKETRGSVLLSRKARCLNKWYEAREAAGYYGFDIPNDEKRVSTTSQRLRWKVLSDEERASLSTMIGLSLYRPFHLLLTEPVVFWFSLWVAFSWAVLYLTLAAIPLVFMRNHGFSLQQANAVFASVGIASILSVVLSIFQERIAKRNGKLVDAPEGRLYFACVESAALPIGLFMFGWTSFSGVPWIVPAIAIGIATIGIFSIYLATFNYLADTYHRYASSALAAQSFCRNILGKPIYFLSSGIFPLITTSMYTGLGFAPASSLLGGIGMLLTAVPWVLVLYGPRIRARSKFASEIMHRQLRPCPITSSGFSTDCSCRTNNMDDLLPSYESVIQRDPWILIAPYLTSHDLCSTALVCRKWHEIFTRHLWGSPASHFGVQNDTVYVALTRFKRALPLVRVFVRELTHTLHFPPAHAELYDGPHAEWLRDCLEYLPRLQCLIVDGLPFFDHASLVSLRYPSLRWKSTRPNTFPVFSLRLLDASGCTNATSTGLTEALPHFPDLVSLDLSKTPAAKDKVFLKTLAYLRNLRVLNLRGLGLRDDEFSVVVAAVGNRVRSLDISDNDLTDTSARLLLQHCLKETVIAAHNFQGPLPPVELERPDGQEDVFETENIVSHLRKKLTEGFVGSLAIEETRDGVSHVYLSNNNITIEGISGLLRSGRLQVLDAGILSATIRNPAPVTMEVEQDDVELSSVAKLVPILSNYASHKLKYLRVNYQVVTEETPSLMTTALPRVELCGDLGTYKPCGAHELDAAGPATLELDSQSTTIYELHGNSSFVAELPSSTSIYEAPGSTPSSLERILGHRSGAHEILVTDVTSQPPAINRGSLYAPEPIKVESPLPPRSDMGRNDENYAIGPAAAVLDPRTRLSPLMPISNSNIPIEAENIQTSLRPNSLYDVEERKARLDFRQSQEYCLHPGMLPKLHTLVLTSVPATTTDRTLITRIIQFIKDTSEEAMMARQRARRTYVLPPGRNRAIAESEYARNLFALQRIVLEMAPPQTAPKKISSSWRAYPTKSSTQDADSEAFWEAATHDFSFFDDEECGQPGYETRSSLPLAAMSGLELAPSHGTSSVEHGEEVADTRPLLDVVGEIGKFRRERKGVYDGLVKRGEADPDVEGYWPGNITIMRKPVDAEAGELDCYGNRYESGWYYR
ncbi:mfs multidrug [Pyrenophora seminiperda CCB06]|uniref:Mfs multidrug n=1 Tax=Pyrenophora seminiperda CCB06 TaxID=1302712 RepID=A0A3M7M5K6_9PLEO|nr:mfs multidrug [Pyrenophora seminiperda CCB06]